MALYSDLKNPVPLWLLEHLEEQFPNKVPLNQDLTLGDLKVLQGKQIIINYIRSLVDQEE
jgi:hypothetical protein